MTPGILVYVYVGTAVSSIGALFEQSSGSSLIKIISFGVGLIFAIAAIIVIVVYTKRELNKVLHELENNNAINSMNDAENNIIQEVINDSSRNNDDIIQYENEVNTINPPALNYENSLININQHSENISKSSEDAREKRALD